MQITNKKELLNALTEVWVPRRVNSHGEAGSTSIFEELDSDRAWQINTEMQENLVEDLTENIGAERSPAEFVRVLGRNLELNGDLELLHFMWQAGILYDTILNLNRTGGIKPPAIGEN